MSSEAPGRRLTAGHLLTLAAVVAAVAAAGIGMRATHGARTTADEPQYLLSALSLATDGDLDISDEISGGAYRPFHEIPLDRQTEIRDDGSQISPHDPLLPAVLALPMGLGGWVAAKAALALLAGALAAATAWVAHRRFGVGAPMAVLAAGAAGTTAPLAAYGSQVYPEVPAALALVVAVGLAAGPLERRPHRWALAAALVALPWLSVKYVPAAATVGALALARLARRDRRAAVGLAAVVAAAGAAYLAVHRAVWGGWTAYASGDHFTEAGELSVMGVDPDFAGRATRLLGLLVDDAYGLAAWTPAWLLAVPAVAALVRRRPPGWELLALPLAAGWLTATFVALTMHGFWFPGRQVVVVAPLAVIAVARFLDGRAAPSAWRVAAVVGVAAGAVAWGWQVWETTAGHEVLVVDVASTANPLFRGWTAVLPDGRDPSAADHGLMAVWAVVATGLAVAGATAGAGRSGQDEDALGGEGAHTDVVVAADLDGGGAVR